MGGKRYGQGVLGYGQTKAARKPAANTNNSRLRRFQIAVTEHFLDYAGQTVLHGLKYFANRGYIMGGEEAKTGKVVELKMSRFDRLVS